MKTFLVSFIIVLLNISIVLAQGADDLDIVVKSKTVTLALPEPCSSTVNVKNVKENVQFSIFPNPSRGFIYLTISSPGKLSNTSLMVFDIMGKKVFEVKNPDRILEPNYPIDLSRLSDGIYFISVGIEDKKTSQKLIINKASK